MNSQLLHARNVLVQGITGKHGSFHTLAMLAAGTNIVAGTSPNKAGEVFNNSIPVYGTAQEAIKQHTIDATVIFVPAPFAKSALLEAIDVHIPLIVCITEGIPIHDMLEVTAKAKAAHITLIGPNCPGILLPGRLKLGIIPASMGLAGSVGIVSRSGTLTYEAAASLSARGIGQKYIIGIGGDPIKGANFIDCLQLFQDDPDVSSTVLIGEIGGTDEQLAAKFICASVTKPVYSYIAGHAAPMGVQLGHAGAILGSDDESAASKTAALKAAGAHTFTTIVDLVDAVG